MHKKRMNERINVDLPVACTIEHKHQEHLALGKITDISISGMKIELALPTTHINSPYIDFEVDLPNPFSKIKGSAQVQWKRWDSHKRNTTCGLKLEPMNLQHLLELDNIITEIQEDAAKSK